MAHLKRQKIPKNWPIHRKGTKYVVTPNFKGLAILIILRDILKLAQNRKEVKRALHAKHILLNGKIVKDEKNSALLFDVITNVPAKENYRIELSDKGKFKVEKVSEASNKIAKIMNKKTLKGKKTQLNLSDGRNVLSEIKCSVGDSVLISFKDNKIEKCLGMKEKAKVIVIAGKHAGETGIIKSIKPRRKMAGLSVDEKEIPKEGTRTSNEASGKEVNVLIKQLMVVEAK